MPGILITTSSFETDIPEIRALKQAGYAVVLNPHGRRLTETEVGTLLGPDIVGMIAGVEPLTRAVLEKAKNLRVISRCGAGLDSVDVEAARDRNIAVYNTPEAPAAAVAELTIGLMLDVLRGLSRQDRDMRQRKWTRPTGGLLSACTVGLVGFGNIGQRVANILHGFGACVLAHDSRAESLSTANVTLASFEQILKTSDIVSLHIPYTLQTRHLLNRETLGLMKKGSILVNTARGGLVDEDALADALSSGSLAGAALDVYETEPYTGRLTTLDTVVLTSHTGSCARETRTLQETEAVRNLLCGLGLSQKEEQAA